MKKILCCLALLLNLYHSQGYSQEDTQISKTEENNFVPSITTLPPSTRQTLANLKYLRKLDNFDSNSPLAFMLKPNPAIVYARITEKEQYALKIKNRYNQLVRIIKDRTVSDEDLFIIFFKEFSKKTDLDHMHKLFNDKSLAKILMKVTCSYDWVYKSERIIKGSKGDKFKTCFRYLGNCIYRINLKKCYQNIYLSFSHSKLKMKFKIYSYYLDQYFGLLTLKHPYAEQDLKAKNSSLDKKLVPFLKDLLKEESTSQLSCCIIS